MLNPQALKLVHQYLAQFAARDDFEESIASIYGTRLGGAAIRRQWLAGDFSLIPEIRVLANGELGTANGAYAADLDEILVSADFLKARANDPLAIAGLLLEEIGHKLDRLFNGNVDTLGDEGAIFRLVVTGQAVSAEVLAGLRGKDDRSVIAVDGVAVAVERQDFFGDAGGIVTNDNIVGTAGDDNISPGLGTDNVNGGAGNDTLIVDYSANDYTGTLSKGIISSFSSGSGVVFAYKGATNNFDQVSFFGIENLNITGTKYNDNLVGSTGNDVLKGGAGDDTIRGNGGVDILDGGTGTDLAIINISNLTGNNNINLNQSNITLANGTQLLNIEKFNLTTGTGDDTIRAGNFGDDITSGAGNDTITGGAGNDTIDAGDGNDTIGSGLGTDNVNGGAGNDTLIVDYSANDYTGTLQKGIISSFSSGSGVVFAYKGATNNFDQVSFFGIENLNITGTKYNDNLVGSTGNDVLKGGTGDDTIRGNGGIDTLTGGTGQDSFILTNYAAQGNNDYALIKDFNPIEDRLTLDAATTSFTIANTANIPGVTGAALFKGTDLVAVLEGVSAASLNPVDLAGSDRATAYNLGKLSATPVTINEFVGQRLVTIDPSDFYKVEVTEASVLSVQIAGNTLTPNIRLLDSNGVQLRQSTTGDLNFSVKAGQYFIALDGLASDRGTNYQLAASAKPIPDFAGNDVGTARNLGALTGTQTYSDFVGNVDAYDFYRFEVKQTSQFSSIINNEILSVNNRIDLIASNGQTLVFGSNKIDRQLAPGIYYLRVNGNAGDSNYKLDLSALPTAVGQLAITRVSPVRGSNAGKTTITIEGNQFTANTKPTLIDSTGKVITLDNVTVISDTKIVATANLTNAALGNYRLNLVDGTKTASANNIFAVDSSNPGKLEVFIGAPGAVRAFATGEIIVTYRNGGDTDIPAPLLTINTAGAKFEQDGKYDQDSIQFLGISKDGNAGVLAPGATGTYKINFRPTGVGNIDFTASSLDTASSIDWNSIKNSSRPADIAPATWDLIYQNFVNSVSNDAAKFQEILGENATRLSQLGEYTGDIEDLLAFELRQNAADSIGDRNFIGSFGRGGVNAFEITQIVDASGNVTIKNGTIQRLFNKQSAGTIKADDPNDLGVITKVGSVYQLREYDGTVLTFRTDGKLDFVTDPNNNKVTVGYTSNQLTSLSYSNGDIITFAYNAQGRVNEITDQYGQKTTYTYDAAGDKLLSITDNSGTVSYTYETTGAKANAIKSITNPDGTQTLYEYDNTGRITKLSNGTNSVSYSYDTAGGVTVTDANGKTTRILTNADGQIAQATDSLGRTIKYSYDDNGNLKQVIAPDNSTAKLTYDSRGNVVGSVDALNQQVNYTYNSTYDQLTQVRDQKGNSIVYSYDTKGNLSGITYADGSQDKFNYDANGNTTISSNRRGQEIKYTYDSRQFLIGKEFADGTTASFTYDSRGNLTKATDSDSTVSYAYDNADRLTKVTYDNNRFLDFTYNAGGQRTKMVDQDGFATNYSYDTVGRLKQLTDKTGANIVTYTYNNLGQLAREDNGNGTYTTYTYDDAGQALNIVNFKADNSVNSRFDYTYDILGRRDSMTTLDGKTTYGYDAIGQLTKVTLPTGRIIEYQYDAAGNRTTVKDSGTTTTYNTNNLNQYTTAGSATYTYDTDGNLTAKTAGGITTTYTYDTENRLIGVTNPSGTWQYKYDALGNRIATIQNGTRTDYLLDPTGLGDVVGEYNGANKIANYTHGLGLVSQVDSANNTAFYDADVIGSIAGLTGTNGSYVNRYSYLPFGESLTKTEGIANPFEFVGQYGVMNESSGLDFMRARFYTPGEGRFLNTDPIGINGGLNLYRYVLNSPINFVDPEGENPFWTGFAIGVGVTVYDIGINGRGECFGANRDCAGYTKEQFDKLPDRTQKSAAIHDQELSDIRKQNPNTGWQDLSNPKVKDAHKRLIKNLNSDDPLDFGPVKFPNPAPVHNPKGSPQNQKSKGSLPKAAPQKKDNGNSSGSPTQKNTPSKNGGIG